MILDRIKFLLESCSTSDAAIPPTDLYNEGWMLRLVLDWLHRNRDQSVHTAIPFPTDARWYSEALLPSAFLPRERGDKLAESYTHADGVIGQFTIGAGAKGNLSLESEESNARCFVVVEAKMFSKLSPGVTNASFYNQAARNVACMAYVLSDAKTRPENIGTLGFYVVAPEARIKEPAFSPYMTREHIEKTVKLRVDGYEGERDEWFKDCFLPALERIDIDTIAWEDIVSEIAGQDATYGAALLEFYRECLRFNGPETR